MQSIEAIIWKEYIHEPGTCVLFTDISFDFLVNDGYFDHWLMERLKGTFQIYEQVNKIKCKKFPIFWQNADSFNQV